MDQSSVASAHRAEVHPARIYTQPELRARLKAALLSGDRGGAPGEWGPKKAELLAHEYRQAGGGYTFAKRGPAPTQSPDPGEPSGEAPRPPQQAWTDYAAAIRPAGDGTPRDDAYAEQPPASSSEARRPTRSGSAGE